MFFFRYCCMRNRLKSASWGGVNFDSALLRSSLLIFTARISTFMKFAGKPNCGRIQILSKETVHLYANTA